MAKRAAKAASTVTVAFAKARYIFIPIISLLYAAAMPPAAVCSPHIGMLFILAEGVREVVRFCFTISSVCPTVGSVICPAESDALASTYILTGRGVDFIRALNPDVGLPVCCMAPCTW